ncbi:MAG: TonB-dependent receptor [Muribaculaceae bacterium]|nr:TonB-dependent receptor [Muribaculaceae bacterium]
MNFLRALPLILSPAVALSAWANIIVGNVNDIDNSPLPGVTVMLFSVPDSVRTAFAVTDIDGQFSLPEVKPGMYMLHASMVGMEDVNKDVVVKESPDSINVGKIVLSETSLALKEAVVTGVKTAVIAKQDTIEFNAGSYHTAQNATVNDLLKKLPGVEVGSDGSISSNGKTVSKILVNGKEFFGDDPQMATKNLPSNMVDKVQVVDRKSELTRLTGVDDGEEETVINLTVKKNMNNGWFGNASAGYGTDHRYQGSFVVNNFFNGNQITFLGGLNNINEMGFSDRGRGNFRDFGGNNGINTSQRFGINFNVGKEEIFRVGGNVMYSHSDRHSISRKATQFLYPDYENYQDANSDSRDTGHNIHADFRMQWNISPYNTLEFRPNFSLNFRKSSLSSLSELSDENKEKINRNYNVSTNKGKSVEAGGNLIFNHKFSSHPGRSFSVQARYNFSDTRQKSTSWSNIIYYLVSDKDDEELYRFLDNHTWSNNINTRLTWTEPLGDVKKGNFLSIAYRLSYQWNNADKLTYNLPTPENAEDFIPSFLDELPGNALFDADLSNSFRNNFFSQELQAGYQKITKKLNLNAGILFSPSSSKSTDLINSARNIPTRWVYNFAPYANIRYRFGTSSSLRANYRARTSQPSMTQLQPVRDESDPLNIVQGNPELKPTFTQSVGLFFNDFNMTRQQSLFAVVNASFALNSIVSKTITDRETGARTTTYGNVNGNFNIFGMAMITRPFRNRKWRCNGRINARFANTPGYINGDFNRTGNLSLSPSAGLTFSSDIFQMSLNPTYSFGNVTNSLPDQPDRQTHSYGFNSDISVFLPFGLELTTDLAFSNSTGYSSGFNSKQWLWNAQISYSFLKSKELTFSVRAYDLLGQKKNISRSVGANSIVDSWFNDLTRYVMFGLTWNFNTLSKKGKGPDGESDMLPPLPPAGGPGMRHGPGPGGRRPF